MSGRAVLITIPKRHISSNNTLHASHVVPRGVDINIDELYFNQDDPVPVDLPIDFTDLIRTNWVIITNLRWSRFA